MKKLILMMTITGGILSTGLTSCNDNDLSKDSIFRNDTSLVQENRFDQWINNNYVADYNVQLLYRFSSIEADHSYVLAAADIQNAERLALIVKYCWFEAYDEVAGISFTRQYVPKTLQMIGSPAYNNNGTIVLGTAEGGKKVTLYMVNSFTVDRETLNTYYFHTMHHEFAHILHQKKGYDEEYFNRISEGNYVSGDWYMQEDTTAYHKGFVSAYAMSEPREDIAEMTSIYITSTQAEWNAILSEAGETGAPIIEKKLRFVKEYMQTSWGIDMDELRDVIQSRMNDVVSGNLDLDAFVNSLK